MFVCWYVVFFTRWPEAQSSLHIGSNDLVLIKEAHDTVLGLFDKYTKSSQLCILSRYFVQFSQDQQRTLKSMQEKYRNVKM